MADEQKVTGKVRKSKRCFSIVSAYSDKGVVLPKRATQHSAGYDISAAEDITISGKSFAVIPTGIKAYMQNDEYLGIHIRSGLSIKKGISLLNDEGIIDSDYYDNPDNEGHILIALLNNSDDVLVIKKGDRIAQGIFKKFLLADSDSTEKNRVGGVGSTDGNSI